MALPTDDDMIVILTHHVRTLGHNPILEFSQLDATLNFVDGTTARLLEVAADDAGYEIARKGSTHASLQRRQARLIRA
jgi:hypothetical protein